MVGTNASGKPLFWGVKKDGLDVMEPAGKHIRRAYPRVFKQQRRAKVWVELEIRRAAVKES